MDAEIQKALDSWLETEMREKMGPTPLTNPEKSDVWWGPSCAFRVVFDDIQPGLFDLIDPYYHETYYLTWPLLPDRVIGVLMKAGAVDYLPPVERHSE